MKNFKKSDLKTGMRVETRNGDFHIYYKKAGKIIDNENEIYYIDDYNETFNDVDEDNIRKFDIMKIYDIPEDTDGIFDFGCKGELLWERKEEEPFITVDGIEYSESTTISIIKNSHKD